MTTSLPTYDLVRLFSHYSQHSNTRDSGGEALVEVMIEETNSSRDLSSASEGDSRVMTDSLSTVSWEDIKDDDEDYHNDIIFITS